MTARSICGIIVSEMRPPEGARRLSENMKNCPHLIASGTKSNVNYSVYIVPKNKLWWLKYPENDPAVIGAEKAHVQVVQNLMYPPDFSPKLTGRKAETAPCGADCPACHLRAEYDCSGVLQHITTRTLDMAIPANSRADARASSLL